MSARMPAAKAIDAFQNPPRYRQSEILGGKIGLGARLARDGAPLARLGALAKHQLASFGIEIGIAAIVINVDPVHPVGYVVFSDLKEALGPLGYQLSGRGAQVITEDYW